MKRIMVLVIGSMIGFVTSCKGAAELALFIKPSGARSHLRASLFRSFHEYERFHDFFSTPFWVEILTLLHF